MDLSPLDHPARLTAARRLLEALPGKPIPAIEDELRQLAEKLDVPLAAATLLDGRDQHFIATSHGPEPSLHRSTSHCQYVIATGAYLCIADVSNDSVFRRLARALVGGEPVNAYLGFPLKYDGETVGAVCVADNKAREWSTADQFEVYAVSRVVAELLDG